MKVSCIVPAYNEAKRISDVLEILTQHDLVDEVIVINDASTDSTKEVLKNISGIILISHEINKGKTQAVLTGLHHAKNNFVMLIDADLVGLSKDAITDLIMPVIQNTSDITISLRKNALLAYKLMGIDFVSGERVFNKHLLLDNEKELINLPGFGLEVFINQIIVSKKLRLQVVLWNHVISPRKSAKMGFFLGSLGDIKMILQILRTVPVSKCVHQMYVMRKLSRG